MTTSTADAPWWTDRVGYQIYPRSFADSDGDGIGDIPGIIDKLDHLADLGIGVLWLSPVYTSPMADNGYDIADYYGIEPTFGTMEDFDRLLAEAKARDIGIVMDLVVNHTSDQHNWFLNAAKSTDAPLREFYIWRDPAPGGGPPDDRQAFFGGPAWSLSPETGQYYFHLFSPGQPDLNWRNPEMRAEVYRMMRWWVDKGIAGFRMDVIDLIGKDLTTGEIEEGPYLHEYIQEMRREALAGEHLLTIGESWNVTTDTALLYTGRDRGELDMVFQFEHIVQGWDAVHGKWAPKPFHLPEFKSVFARWQETLAEDGWNALFLNNHDLPRAVSRYGDDDEHRVNSAKAIATALHFMKGMPFVYQGEEIGMTNAAFTHIDQFRDLETLNLFHEWTGQGMTDADFIRGANANARDNARTPMQWTSGPRAGFTSGTPWIEVHPNHRHLNVAQERETEDGVLAHYKRLIAARRAHPVIVHGRYDAQLADHEKLWAYTRSLNGTTLAVIVNMSGASVEADLPPALRVTGQDLIATHGPRGALSDRIRMAPWESVAVLAA
ncbi:oligo-1,6-glucosidase [Tranquillimonas rosea]|uniref:Oligo-1,6-glucosidase n=1 Tax=Tranquillimonas rosea TaxID=641238 RepID=A0A1H9TPP9_9RHOB|nr:alpha-glucosidase [Tranquillimonas rosea]SER98613.1 oligo-1,6-glucosidase [Tranquillimonas rosea]